MFLLLVPGTDDASTLDTVLPLHAKGAYTGLVLIGWSADHLNGMPTVKSTLDSQIGEPHFLSIARS